MPVAPTKIVYGWLENLSASAIADAQLYLDPSASIIQVGDTIVVGMASGDVPGEIIVPLASDGSFSFPMVAVDNPTWTVTATVRGKNIETPYPSFIMIPPPATPSSAASASIGTLVVGAASGVGIPQAAGKVQSVNSVLPDALGNVQLSVDKLGGLSSSDPILDTFARKTAVVPLPSSIANGQVLQYNSASGGSWSGASVMTQTQGDARYIQPADAAATYLSKANAGARVVVLGASDAVPSGTPAGSVIVRTGAAVSTPVAAFSSSVSNLTVAFNGTGSSDTGGTINTYAWSFGDGQNGTGSTVTHVYSAAGTYTVSLTVTDNLGATNTVTKTVTTTAQTGAQAGYITAGSPTSGSQLTVPSGITASHTLLIFAGGSTAAPTSVTASGSNGGTFTTVMGPLTATNGAFTMLAASGLNAGDVVTVNTAGQGLRQLSHWYFKGTLTVGSAAVRPASQTTDNAPAVTVGSNQNLYVISGFRNQSSPTLTGVTNANGSATNTLNSYFDTSANTWAVLAQISAAAGSSGVSTVTYSPAGTNGFAVHILETPQ